MSESARRHAACAEGDYEAGDHAKCAEGEQVGLAGNRQIVESEADGVVGDESASSAEAVDALQEHAHEEQASKPAREDAEEALELVIDVADVGIGKPERERAAENADGDGTRLAAKKLRAVVRPFRE